MVLNDKYHPYGGIARSCARSPSGRVQLRSQLALRSLTLGAGRAETNTARMFFRLVASEKMSNRSKKVLLGASNDSFDVRPLKIPNSRMTKMVKIKGNSKESYPLTLRRPPALALWRPPALYGQVRTSGWTRSTRMSLYF